MKKKNPRSVWVQSCVVFDGSSHFRCSQAHFPVMTNRSWLHSLNWGLILDDCLRAIYQSCGGKEASSKHRCRGETSQHAESYCGFPQWSAVRVYGFKRKTKHDETAAKIPPQPSKHSSVETSLPRHVSCHCFWKAFTSPTLICSMKKSEGKKKKSCLTKTFKRKHSAIWENITKRGIKATNRNRVTGGGAISKCPSQTHGWETRCREESQPK